MLPIREIHKSHVAEALDGFVVFFAKNISIDCELFFGRVNRSRQLSLFVALTHLLVQLLCIPKLCKLRLVEGAHSTNVFDKALRIDPL